MKKKTAKKSVKRIPWDPQKDSIFKQLAGILGESGFSVRREELKQGHGWRVMSGLCRLNDSRLIFVDKKLPQDEQITFLVQRMAALKVRPTEAQLSEIPEKVREMIVASQAAIAA